MGVYEKKVFRFWNRAIWGEFEECWEYRYIGNILSQDGRIDIGISLCSKIDMYKGKDNGLTGFGSYRASHV